MSIDSLQDKIRKLKNPTVVDFSIMPEHLPPHLLEEEGSFSGAYVRFCRELLAGLSDLVPGVRFSFSAFALLGEKGLTELRQLMEDAHNRGYYVFLDGPEVLTPWGAERGSDILREWACDSLIFSPYIGEDAFKPLRKLGKVGKTAFALVRSANKSAPQLQDLISGTRVVHEASADLVQRFGDGDMGRCGYSQIGAAVSATSASSVKRLRGKYPHTFLFVDGLDYPSGNARNCSYAFDKLGHGAVVCVGPSLTAAWREEEGDGRDYVAKAVAAGERVRYNLTRYVTIL